MFSRFSIRRVRGFIGFFYGVGLAVAAVTVSAEAGSFVATGSMHVPREGHTATLLTNGLVLVVGGEGSNSPVNEGVTATAELYNPATGIWTYTGSLNTPRGNHTATLLLNGQVLIAGGDDTTTNYLKSCELYNPSNGTFRATGSLNYARRFHTATLMPDGSALVAGGYDGSYWGVSETYNPTTEAWKTNGVLSPGRDLLASAMLFDGTVLAIGGVAGTSDYAKVDSYDVTSGLWSPVGSLAVGRQRIAATLLRDGFVLVAGGATTAGVTNSAELYDPATQEWNGTAPMSTRRDWQSATLLMDGTVLMAGGNLNSTTKPTNTAEIYHPDTGQWTAAGSMATNRAYHTATLLPDGRVLIAGGLNGTGIAEAELYGGPAPAPSPILLDNATTQTNETFQLQFTNQPGGIFGVYGSTDLTNWSSLGNAVEVPPGSYQFSDSGESNQAQRFYRVQTQ